MLSKKINIAIDGPAASGKSTIGKLIAKNNNWIFVSSGLIFRAYAYLLIENNLSKDSIEKQVNFLSKVNLSWIDNNFYVNSLNITEFLNTDEVSNLASSIAKNISIRSLFNNFLKKIAYNNDVVIDGRDIGTVILPNADLKIFLKASLLKRAQRRAKQNNTSFTKNYFYLFKRDFNDKHRKIAPLKKSKDAYVISSTKKNIEQVINEIQLLISKRFY